MERKQIRRKIASLLLCLCLMLSCVPTPAVAVTEDGLCEHHPEHTEECGYVEGEHSCGYVCEECAAAQEEPEEEAEEEPAEEPEEEPAPEEAPQDEPPAGDEEQEPDSEEDADSDTEEEPKVAQIGESYYASFSAAVEAAASGDTITLLADDTWDGDLAIQKTLTLDLNGQTLTGTISLGYILSTEYTGESAAMTILDGGTGGQIDGIIDVGCGTVEIVSGTVAEIYGYRYSIQVTGGTITTLMIDDWYTDCALSGGSFSAIEIAQSIERPFYTLLAEGYAYQKDGQLYAPDTEEAASSSASRIKVVFNTINDVTVVKCDSHEYEDGVCRYCQTPCPHESYTDGICDVCGTVCQHESYENGICTVCGLPCLHEHYTNGFCDACDDCQPAVLSGDVYEISNAGQLYWFAAQVNSGDTDANAVLVNSIAFRDEDWTPIGTLEQPYSGTFDGGGQRIEEFSLTVTGNNSGLFGVVSDSTVKNFTLYGDLTISQTVTNVGSVVGLAQKGAKIENVTSHATITDSRPRTNITVGTTTTRLDGIGGIVGGLDGSNGACTVTRCSNEGSINTQYAAAVGGIVGRSTNNCVVSYCENNGEITVKDTSSHVGGIVGCAMTGTQVTCCLNFGNVTFEGTDCIGGIVGYANENVKITCCGNLGVITSTLKGQSTGGILGYVNNPNFSGLTNCYNYNNVSENGGAIVGTCNSNTKVSVFQNNYYLTGTATRVSNTQTISDVYEMTSDQFASGEVAYKLGGEWKQNIGDDIYPNFTGQVVYGGDEACGSEYNNTTHSFDAKGFCTATEGQTHYQPAVLNSDGYYEISNAGQLFWFAAQVNDGETSINAKLMADIDLESRDWTPIGLYSDVSADSDSNAQYGGTFDGNFHVIRNLNVNMTDSYEAGLFSRVQGGTLKNLGVVNATVTQSYKDTNDKGVRAGIIAGEIYQATVTNVFSAGTLSITTSHDQTGGLAGECKDSTLKSCFTTMGILTDGRTGNTPSSVTDCHYMAASENDNSAGAYTVEAVFTSGELTWQLNGYTAEGNWKQTIGEDDYPNFTGKTVYYNGTNSYYNKLDEDDLRNITISWGAMEFTYTDGGWNTETHTYDTAGWTATGNTVTVANSGNVAVQATVNYENAEGYAFAAIWDKKTAKIAAGGDFTFTMNLSGKPGAALNEATVGSVTVKLTDANTPEGWVLSEDGYLCYYEDGGVVTGTKTIDGVEYNLNAAVGAAGVYGLITLDGKWYYFNSMGFPEKGWAPITENGVKVYYYIKDDWTLARNETLEIDGVTYSFDDDGHSDKEPDDLYGNNDILNPEV